MKRPLTPKQRELLRKMIGLNLALVKRDSRGDKRYFLADPVTFEIFDDEPVNPSTAGSLTDRSDCLRFDPEASGNLRKVWKTL